MTYGFKMANNVTDLRVTGTSPVKNETVDEGEYKVLLSSPLIVLCDMF